MLPDLANNRPSTRHLKGASLFATTAFALLLPARGHAQSAQPAPQAQSTQPNAKAGKPAAAASEDVIVTGTRQANRTRLSSAAPVDVVSHAMLVRTGQTSVFDSLNAILPSFEIPAEGGDISRLIRSARLRGLSPDDTLVLIDGERRHISAMINTDVGPVGGSDPVDLDMIGSSMIDHIEVLRDGAAAQYGSDAIAGVINIITQKKTSGGSAYAQEGAFYPSDGFTNSIGGSYAMPIGADGYLDVSVDYRHHDHTNRCGLDPRAAAFGITQNPCKTAGDPAYDLVTPGYSAGYDFGTLTAYSVGTYGYRDSLGYNGWRPPNKYSSPWYQANYPDGFVPAEGLNENDFAETAGLKGLIADQWHWNLASTYGADFDKIYNVGDLNPSLITTTSYLISPVPQSIYAGGFDDSEWTNNLDITRSLNTGLFAKPLDVAFGGEFRRNTYQENGGSYASSFGEGASSYPGITKADAVHASRRNEAGYIDLATDLLPHWQVDIAGRFEHYSDFGNTPTGKISSRYDFTPWLGIRGTLSDGFRAPTLPQEYETELNVTPEKASGQLPVNSPGAEALGATPLRAEQSKNYSIGLTLQPISRMHIAVDAYQIEIRNQIEDSGLIGANKATDPQLYDRALAALTQSGFAVDPTITQVFTQFYTNGIATRTRGIDFTMDYAMNGPWEGRINWTLGVNVNHVGLTNVSKFANGSTEFTPDVLSEITEDAPQYKVVLQADYSVQAWTFTLRNTLYGKTAEVMADQDLGPPHYYTNVITPKVITDLQIGYNITRNVQVLVGANNLLNIYPNKTVYQTRDVSNSEVYPYNSPFGFDGGSYYLRLNYKF